ncbi:MAG: hypothetical protein WAL99_18040 [Pseudonocardiaceae bacterium]
MTLVDAIYLMVGASVTDLIWYVIGVPLVVLLARGLVSATRASRAYLVQRTEGLDDAGGDRGVVEIEPPESASADLDDDDDVIGPDMREVTTNRSRLVTSLRKGIGYLRSRWPDFELRVKTAVDVEGDKTTSGVAAARDKAWRLITGRTLDPKYDRLMWFKKPSNDYYQYDSFDSWWVGMRGRRRLGFRLASVLEALVLVKVAVLSGSSWLHLAGLVLLLAGVLMAAVGGVLLTWRLTSTRYTNRVLVEPLTYGLLSIVDLRGEHPVMMNKNAGKRGITELQVDLTLDHLSKVKKAEITTCVRERISGDLMPTFAMSGYGPRVTFTAPQKPPETVPWSMIHHLAARSWGDRRMLLGLGCGEFNPIYWDFTKAPHALFSAATGGGKSISVTGFALQALMGGGKVIMLDTKEISHRWARDIPGLEYYDDVAGVHHVLHELAEGELPRRIEILKGAPLDIEDEDIDVGPRMLIIMEELNDTMAMLKRFWRESPLADRRTPSPAVQGLHTIGSKGRALKMHLVVLAQSASVMALGGRDARENYPARLISAAATAKTWNMLTDIRPRPPWSTLPGRYHYAIGGQAREVQAPYITVKEARPLAFAAMGKIWAPSERDVWMPNEGTVVHNAEPVPGSTFVPAIDDTSSDQAKEKVQVLPGTPSIPSAAQFMTLAEAMEHCPELAPSLNALTTDRTRHPDAFPARKTKRGREFTYDLDELKVYRGVDVDDE